MRITEHPIWERIQSYIDVEWRDDRPNIEVNFGKVGQEGAASNEFIKEASDTRINCAACGTEIVAFRMRKAQGDRMKLPRDVYFSATCSPAVNSGCTRTKAAREEHRRVVAEIEDERRPVTQVVEDSPQVAA